MTHMPTIATARLAAQQLVTPRHAAPEDVVSWLGAVQAQEYGPARWGIGQRLSGRVRDRDIAAAFDAGRLIRTHVLRPTWHFVTPADLRWMLALTGPHVKRSMAAADRRLEIDGVLLGRVRSLISRALEVRGFQTRGELAAALEDGGVVAAGQRLAHLMLHCELDALVCSGPRRGKQFTYALVEQRVAPAPTLTRDEAWRELVLRFYRSHGPATLRDFTWWSGLRMTETRRMLTDLGAGSREEQGVRYWWIESAEAAAVVASPSAWLLPIYDEYTVAYRDRVAVPHSTPGSVAGGPRGVSFQHPLVIDGQIAGTWAPVATGEGVTVHVVPHRRLAAAERQAVEAAATRYGAFLEVATDLQLQAPPRSTIRPR